MNQERGKNDLRSLIWLHMQRRFTALVDVAVSRQFIHWVFALGDGAKIVGPEEVVKFAQEEIRRLQERYLKNGVKGQFYE